MKDQYLLRIEGNATIGFKARVFVDMSAEHVEKFTVIGEATPATFEAQSLDSLMYVLKAHGFA